MARRISGRSHGDPRTADTRAKVKDDYRPSRDEILRYIAENPDRAGKRDIAKAFALRGDDRIWLKDMLRDLQDEGLLTKERKRLARVGALPHVAVLDIFGRDGDGVLLAHPAERRRQRRAAGRLDPRVARRQRPGAGHRRPRAGQDLPHRRCDRPRLYRPGDEDLREAHAMPCSASFACCKDGTFRIEPVERRQPELVVDKEFQNGAKNGDLVEVEPARASRYGLPRAKVLAVLGSLTSEKAVSMIAIHAHDIPHIFPADVIAEAEAVKPATLDQPRGLARPAAGHHRPGRRQGP